MAMADLAKFGGGCAVPLSAIAERQHLSLAYLEQIFVRLRRCDLVVSARGRSGGYKLGRPAEEIRIAEIMLAVEEKTRMTRCMGEETAGCMGDQRCLTHELWHALGAHISSFLETVTLKEVIEGIPLSKRLPTHVSGVEGRKADWIAE